MSTIHHLKSWPQFFGPIRDGSRTHELRRNDRDFAVGDLLVLHEFDPQEQRYTGAECEVEVSSITSLKQPCAVSEDALHPDFCILSIGISQGLRTPPAKTTLRGVITESLDDSALQQQSRL
jgi:hypothetical protein